MERLLTRLERTFGRLAVPHLTRVVVGGTAIAFVLALARPAFLNALVLDPSAVRAGEVWRLFTYLFVPTVSSPIWIVFELMLLWTFGEALEQAWGAFRVNLFYLVGILGTTAAAWLSGDPQGSTWMNRALFLAFATLHPEYTITLFFVLPVRVKWLALVGVGLVGFQLLGASTGTILAAVVAMSNYLLFFSGHLVALLRGRRRLAVQAARRASFRPPPPPVAAVGRACAICGARQEDGADIRVCTCEACAPKRDLCLEHARAH